MCSPILYPYETENNAYVFSWDLWSPVLHPLGPQFPVPSTPNSRLPGPFPFVAKEKKEKKEKLSKLLGNDITLKSDTIF